MSPAASATTWLDLATFAIALYAAGVSSALAARLLRRDRPRVKLFLTGVTVAATATTDMRAYWDVRVVNVGDRPVDCLLVGLLRRAREYDRFIPTPIDPSGGPASNDNTPPVTLDPGGRTHFYFARVADPGTIRGAWIRDSLDREHEVRYPRRTPVGLYRALKLRRAWRRRHAP